MTDSATNILVVGANGQLGRALCALNWPDNYRINGIDRLGLDITDTDAVARTIAEQNYAWVINAAAYTNVERAEEDAATAFAVNCDGARNVARICQDVGAAMIQLSTDYVFDGSKLQSYVEDDDVAPLNVYGESKAAGESAVRETLDRHLVIRTAWLVSQKAPNFVTTILRQIGLGNELRVVDDQVGSLTVADDLAAAIAAIIEKIQATPESSTHNIWGTYHCTNAGRASWYDIARHIVAETVASHSRETAVTPVTSDEYFSKARRPQNSTLNCHLLADRFDVGMRSWQAAATSLLRTMVGETPAQIGGRK